MLPIEEEFINKKLNNLFEDSILKIGNMYDFNPLDFWDTTFKYGILLEYKLFFDYERYAKLCLYGNSIPRNRIIYMPRKTNDDVFDIVHPYKIRFQYKLLCPSLNNKIVDKEYVVKYYDPIESKQVMVKILKRFTNDCLAMFKPVD